MIVGRAMWTQSTSVTDGQTDGRTDGQRDRITITKTVQRIASNCKNDDVRVSMLHAKRQFYRLSCADDGSIEAWSGSRCGWHRRDRLSLLVI